jgi:gamma-glutamyl phosphate reductase
MGQKSEPPGVRQVYVLGLDRRGHPRGARFSILKDSIVSAAMDMNCLILIRQPADVSALASKLPLGYVLGTGKTVRLLIPRIGSRLYRQILEASRVAIIHEEASIAAAISTTVH